MNSTVIAVGSNINPEENVCLAEKEIESLGVLLKKSDFFYTKPLLYENQDDFYNGVFLLHTHYPLIELKKQLKLLENKLGRVRTANKNGPRTIDLDIVLFNNQILDKDVFVRDFVKEPILEILPQFKSLIESRFYQEHFEQVKTVLDIVLEQMLEPPVAILGARECFTKKKDCNKIVELLVVTCTSCPEIEKNIYKKLKNQINLPVQISFRLLEDINRKYENEKPLNNDEYIVLYGNFNEFI